MNEVVGRLGSVIPVFSLCKCILKPREVLFRNVMENKCCFFCCWKCQTIIRYSVDLIHETFVFIKIYSNPYLPNPC